ncbi:MAG: hypothetical protein AB2A00_09025 [Myxococcota bacterium]
MSLPRHFIARAGVAPVPVGSARPVHALDVLRLHHRHLVDEEWAVTVDPSGVLRLEPGSARGSLPSSVQVELSHHEVARGRPPRVLEASQVYLFDLQVMEQRVETPGPNDPVYLYGELHGPYPSGHPTSVQGQLTVTRADVLHGLLLGAAESFVLQGGENMRCFHALLPGDNEAAIRSGEGLVLAYPLMPAELVVTDASNTALVHELLYDLLAALQVDVRKEALRHPLVDRVLPVPSRAALESQLRAEGYQIKGDSAVRRRGAFSSSGSGSGGMLGAVWGALTAQKVALPPEGDTATFLELARESLKALPGWPDERSQALSTRVRQGPPLSSVTRIPAPPHVPPPPRPTTPPPRGPVRREPADWMRDFMGTHDAPGRSAPRVTSGTSGRSMPAKSASQAPSWMEDFQPQPTRQEPKPEPDSTAKKDRRPDWMKDFD